MSAAEKKRILLAEDDASMRRFLEVALKRSGYEVLTAEDGLEAIEIALEREIHAVVADAIMPNFTGFVLCRILRANEKKKHLPLIILSGLAADNSNHSAADAFLIKDTNLKERLVAALESLLS